MMSKIIIIFRLMIMMPTVIFLTFSTLSLTFKTLLFFSILTFNIYGWQMHNSNYVVDSLIIMFVSPLHRPFYDFCERTSSIKMSVSKISKPYIPILLTVCKNISMKNVIKCFLTQRLEWSHGAPTKNQKPKQNKKLRRSIPINNWSAIFKSTTRSKIKWSSIPNVMERIWECRLRKDLAERSWHNL